MSIIKITKHYPCGLDIKKDDIQAVVEEFANTFEPIESNLNILIDARTKAKFCVCHIYAKKLLALSTIDVPLDPEEQPDYRANRDIVENDVDYKRMIEDAEKQRTFSDIVAEYTCTFNPDYPLKIIGGQHRYEAIKKAHEKGINVYHGLRIYFGLDKEQRLDVQSISNTNIDVSPDLIDRMYETVSGPQLRNWCQAVGLLQKGRDFACKRQRGQAITVRDARTFIMNFYEGKKVNSNKFSDTKTIPLLSKNGIEDPDWRRLKEENPNLWEDKSLKEAAKEFASLAKAQRDYYSKGNSTSNISEQEKAFNYAILSSWAFISGVLQSNKTRLRRHYSLRKQTKTDPLNSSALAGAKHKTDPPNYRGLGTRNDVKERGRCAELFFKQAEKGEGINSALPDIAIKKFHAKIATLEANEAEEKNQ